MQFIFEKQVVDTLSLQIKAITFHMLVRTCGSVIYI